MTLDVRIGQAQLICEEGHFMAHVALCPKADGNICKPTYTAWPDESYRSGSTEFWDFFHTPELEEIYLEMRHYPNSNDLDIVALLPFLPKIQAIPRLGTDADKDRLLWLKHWSQVAVDLFGDQAAISFS
jgi:hypothetical protein